MPVLYTQEELEAFTTRVSCCASNQAYKALKSKQIKGKNTCEYNKHLYLQMSLCTLEDYTPIGTVIDPGEPIHAATSAFVEIDLTPLESTGDGAFLDTVFTINGVDVLIPAFGNAYYADLDTYGAAITNPVNIDPAILLLYTITYNALTNILTITAIATGSAYNGIPVVFSVRKDSLVKEIQYPTVDAGSLDPSAINPTYKLHPNNLCYNSTTQEMWASNFDSLFIGRCTDTAETGIIEDAVILGATLSITHNTISNNYLASCQSGFLTILDSGGNVLSQLSNGVFPSIKAWQGIQHSVTNKLYFPDSSNDHVRILTTADTNDNDINYGVVLGGVYGIGEDPVTNDIYIPGTTGFVKVDYLTNIVTDISILTLGLSATGIVFVDNTGSGGNVEMWVSGMTGGGAEIWIFDMSTTPGTPIADGTIVINTTSGNPRRTFYHPVYKYVVVSSTSGPTMLTLIDGLSRETILASDPDIQTGAGRPWSVNYDPVTNKIFGGIILPAPIDPEDPGYIAVWHIDRENYSFGENLAGGDEENTVEIPPTIVEEDDGTNCLTQEEMYNIIENIKKICGCCCEFDDSILQKDI